MMRLKARSSSATLPICRTRSDLMDSLLVLHAGSLAAMLTGAEMAPDTVGHEAAGCVTSDE
jgi:hypothetical protein